MTCRLMERVADLPKELRHHIYEYITSWALNEQYARTKVTPGKPIDFARRSRVPLYQAVCPPGEPYYLNEKPNNPKHVPHVQSKFMESCGVLDYYKTSEYNNVCELAEALRRYERSRSQQVEQKTGGGGVIDTGVKVNILHDFLDWFWLSTVVDLRSSWLVSPTAGVYRSCNKWVDPNRLSWNSQAWLRNNPQCHTSITRVSLNLDLDLTCLRGSPDHRPGAAGLQSRAIMSEALYISCGAISVMLPNLKSILLFLSLTKVGLNMLLSGERPEYIESIKQLPATERFEVRFGRRSFVTEKEREQERGEQHLKAEKDLEVLLMPYSMEEQLSNLNLAKIRL